MLKAILILPFNVLITIPLIILCFCGFDIISWQKPLLFFLMLVFLVFGLFLMIWTIKLFAEVKKGSLAPWDPINTLITSGPYAYVRNPMLLGVFLVLLAEVIFFQSIPLLLYFLIFICINAFYFPLSEEKGLLKRYGQAYQEYKDNVPRFIPRLTPYKKNIDLSHNC